MSVALFLKIRRMAGMRSATSDVWEAEKVKQEASDGSCQAMETGASLERAGGHLHSTIKHHLDRT